MVILYGCVGLESDSLELENFPGIAEGLAVGPMGRCMGRGNERIFSLCVGRSYVLSGNSR